MSLESGSHTSYVEDQSDLYFLPPDYPIPTKGQTTIPLLSISHMMRPESLDAPLIEDQDFSLSDTIATPDEIVYEEVEGRELARCIADLLNDLSDDERVMIVKKFVLGRTNQEIGEDYGYGREYARKVINAALVKIKTNPKLDKLRDLIE